MTGRAGEPQNFHILDNATSTSLTITFVTGRTGNHLPVHNHIDMKQAESEEMCKNNSDYTWKTTYNHTVEEEVRVWIIVEGLDPVTAYDFQMQAVNQKPQDPESGFIHSCNHSTTGEYQNKTPDVQTCNNIK